MRELQASLKEESRKVEGLAAALQEESRKLRQKELETDELTDKCEHSFIFGEFTPTHSGCSMEHCSAIPAHSRALLVTGGNRISISLRHMYLLGSMQYSSSMRAGCGMQGCRGEAEAE